jgi:effector-binding domain-containing protein
MADVKIMQVNQMPVLSCAYTGPYDQARRHMDDQYQWIMRKGCAIGGPGMGLYYDDPTKVDPVKCRYEICFPMLEAGDGGKVMVRKVLPTQQMASMEHKGGLGNIMSQTYAALFTWIGQNGYVYEAGEPIREVYKVGHLDVTVETDMVTEVQIPVKKA